MSSSHPEIREFDSYVNFVPVHPDWGISGHFSFFVPESSLVELMSVLISGHFFRIFHTKIHPSLSSTVLIIMACPSKVEKEVIDGHNSLLDRLSELDFVTQLSWTEGRFNYLINGVCTVLSKTEISFS